MSRVLHPSLLQVLLGDVAVRVREAGTSLRWSKGSVAPPRGPYPPYPLFHLTFPPSPT